PPPELRPRRPLLSRREPGAARGPCCPRRDTGALAQVGNRSRGRRDGTHVDGAWLEEAACPDLKTEESRMPIFHYVVLTDAKPGRLDEFEEWYDGQHLKDAVAVPEIRSAKRYRLINKITDQVEPAPWCSLAIYEIDADDPVEVTRKLSAMANTAAMPLSDSLV